MQQIAWLIDSSIYVFKAWYRTPDSFKDINGNPVNAVYGFVDFVYKLLASEKPQLIAFAFDESLKTSHRKEIYPEYKANRPQSPETLKRQFGYCREFIRAFGIHESASQLYEADDLIGSWAKSMNIEHIPVNIITADKDLAQLVGEHDHWWEYDRGERFDHKKITRRFGARPDQIADQLAIAGDKTDNIPGVHGIGMSTAGKLLHKFGDLDHLLTNIHMISSMQIRGAVHIQELINTHQERIKLARKLTGIQCDIESVTKEKLSINKLDEKAFAEICEQLMLSYESHDKWLRLHKNLRSV